MKWVGEIKDPVHGYIHFTEVEKEVIDSPAFQRLRRIKQLACADLTYPGAIHTRFVHSIGTMHVSGLIGNHLMEKGYLTEDEVQKLRLAGLLHDVGHGPFSHVYEEILDKYTGLTHEDVGERIIRETEIGDVLERYGYSKVELSKLAVGRLNVKDKMFLNQIIAGHFSSDIMDYLLRDSYFAGVEYGRFDVYRLVESLDLIEGKLAADYSGAFGVLESYIISRIEMFNVVYFHRTVRAANVMLARAMDFAHEELGLCPLKSLEEFLRLDDYKVMLDLESLKSETKNHLVKAYKIYSNLKNRRLFKSTYELILHQRNDFFTNLINKVAIRKRIESEIGEEANIDADYVIIDVPQLLSVPVNPVERRRSEILIYKKTAEGKRVQKVREVSPILSALSEFIDIVRVYTMPEYRDKVEKACEKILGYKPFSERISM
ncbi:MAG: phosphohydrolase [Candidatus Hecatellales archaeon]|nr:MAG: phosphohydrolase [Candidatus Hecatellales archaeon]